MEAALRSLLRACRQLIHARDKGNMTDFWAAVSRIAQALKSIEEMEAKEPCTR